jgi:TPR repeat protein
VAEKIGRSRVPDRAVSGIAHNGLALSGRSAAGAGGGGAVTTFAGSGAGQGDVFAQARRGLIYDKGHGVPQNAVLSYKWLDLAAAHASGRQRDFYLRLRNAAASKMSSEQIIEGQRRALAWAPGRW